MDQKIPEHYPYILTAYHIAEIMSWSNRKAYEVMEYSDFPLIRDGKSKRVRRDAFFEWLSTRERGGEKK